LAHTPPNGEFAQGHRKFVVVCPDTPRQLFYSFLDLEEREGKKNVQIALVFNLRLCINFCHGTSPWPIRNFPSPTNSVNGGAALSSLARVAARPPWPCAGGGQG